MQPLKLTILGSTSPRQPEPASVDTADQGSERRSFPRIAAADLPWIRSVKLANIGEAGLVNLSSAGALLTCRTRLVPKQEVVLQLIGDGNRVRLKGQVVRCEVAAVRNGSMIDYEAAVAFELDRCPLPVSAHLSAAWV